MGLVNKVKTNDRLSALEGFAAAALDIVASDERLLTEAAYPTG